MDRFENRKNESGSVYSYSYRDRDRDAAVHEGDYRRRTILMETEAGRAPMGQGRRAEAERMDIRTGRRGAAAETGEALAKMREDGLRDLA